MKYSFKKQKEFNKQSGSLPNTCNQSFQSQGSYTRPLSELIGSPASFLIPQQLKSIIDLPPVVNSNKHFSSKSLGRSLGRTNSKPTQITFQPKIKIVNSNQRIKQDKYGKYSFQKKLKKKNHSQSFTQNNFFKKKTFKEDGIYQQIKNCYNQSGDQTILFKPLNNQFIQKKINFTTVKNYKLKKQNKEKKIKIINQQLAQQAQQIETFAKKKIPKKKNITQVGQQQQPIIQLRQQTQLIITSPNQFININHYNLNPENSISIKNFPPCDKQEEESKEVISEIMFNNRDIMRSTQVQIGNIPNQEELENRERKRKLRLKEKYKRKRQRQLRRQLLEKRRKQEQLNEKFRIARFQDAQNENQWDQFREHCELYEYMHEKRNNIHFVPYQRKPYFDPIITQQNYFKQSPFYEKVKPLYMASSAEESVSEQDSKLQLFSSNGATIDSESSILYLSDVSTPSDIERTNFYKYMEEYQQKQEKQNKLLQQQNAKIFKQNEE